MLLISVLFSFTSLFAVNDAELLNLLDHKQASPRAVFNLCKKTKLNCTYYKARVLESEGNGGSAMDIYLDLGYYLDFIRLKTYYGDDISELLKKYKINEKDSAYYLGLSEFVRGKWKEAIKLFSKDILKDQVKARFYLGYSYLMVGNIDGAKHVLDSKKKGLDPFDELEFEKLRALILYAENKQFDAQDILINILKKTPNDFISLRYLAHIYYRSGWFNKAEKIYAHLLSREWRDTELYYLLNERCEMRVRYLMFDLAKKDADRIIKEYPKRKDFVAEFVSWLLENGNITLAENYAKNMRPEDAYEESLKLFSLGLISEFKLNDQEALDEIKKANDLYASDEYKNKIRSVENNLKKLNDVPVPEFKCDNYNVKRISDSSWWKVDFKNPSGKNVLYYVYKDQAKYMVVLPMTFLHSKRVDLSSKPAMWSKYVEDLWSTKEMKLKIERKEAIVDSNSIDIIPWPSSFYIKRVSSHEWNVLTAPRTVAHEIGHLLGLVDEYYETDPRVASKNNGRYIGSRTSIMKNAQSGYPEKRHIQFVLLPIKCSK